MIATSKSFLALTANDLMSRDVASVPREMSLRAAAHLLSQLQISGAPVVDADGRCIGVLSVTDFAHFVERGERPARRSHPPVECVCPWQIMDPDMLPVDQVAGYMTTDPVTSSPSTPIRDLARSMLDAHVHRIIVVDAEGRPIGIVSSTDILAAVAYTDHGRDGTRTSEKPGRRISGR